LLFDASGNLYGTTGFGGNGQCNTGVGCGTVFMLMPATHGSWTEKVLYSFQGGSDGEQPVAGLRFDSAGNLYGTASFGGLFSYGIVFELTPAASGEWTESILHAFGSVNDGRSPTTPLVFDSVGNLYGTTEYGGSSSNGIVFELTPGSQQSWSETILHNFAGNTDGSVPIGPLSFDGAGNLYGTTVSGGAPGGAGTVFELEPNGNGTWSERVLHSFGATSTDGLNPNGVVFDSAGNLDGSTGGGGSAGYGTVFQLAAGSGWPETILYSFTGPSDGGYSTAVILDSAGNIYGTSKYGGLAGVGAVFKLSLSSGSWKNKVIYWFPGGAGYDPRANLIADSAGNFYGTTGNGGLYQSGAIFKLSPKSGGGWTESLIYSFKGATDGAYPEGSLAFDAAGNLYGATGAGGTTAGVCSNYGGCGTVFKLTFSSGGQWTKTVLHSFTGAPDGVFPTAGVTFSGGNLFGTTFAGGGNGTECFYIGCGVIFELSPTSGGKWKETVAYAFTGGNDGGEPWYGSLIADASGNLYGTTTYTGCDGCASPYPTVFRFSPNGTGGGTLKTLYAFMDFGLPLGTLALDNAGNIYGTTNSDVYEYSSLGSVFELTKTGGHWSRSTLHSFSGGSDGKYPYAGVSFDAAGNLYGTTVYGGNTTCSCGIVFKLTPTAGGSWSFIAQHRFSGYPRDGAFPYAAVVIDSAGNLYGTTAGGGAYNNGTVYELTP
jgi:uncharacterized repeat protein (TIGR03803 family)